jgi:hypothetical protein
VAGHSHQFVEEYQGLVGFGLDRATDEAALTVYLQKFSDDAHMAVMRERMTDEEIEQLFGLLSRLLRAHLSEPEYHRLFLKEDEPG